MIKMIVELLTLVNKNNSDSEVIDIAKGKYQYPRNIKELYNKLK